MFTERGKWLPLLTWAECLENKGRFMAAIEMVLQDYFKQTSWVLPPHDIDKANILGERYFVDLVAADIAQNIAQADYLLNDKLSVTIRQELLSQLQKRIFQPVLASLRKHELKYNWWLNVTNNWNAVCLNGVTGAALAALPGKKDRAVFIAIAHIYKDNFIAGFSNDGYCFEGLGYYNYGFSRYLFLRENIWQATQGNIDLYKAVKIKNIAAYPLNIRLAANIYPTIADCKVNAKPWDFILYYNNRVLQMGLPQYDTMNFRPPAGNLVEDLLFAFPNSASDKQVSHNQPFSKNNLGYYYFKDAGIVVIPGVEQDRLGVCIKGGNNNEHHNHNDLGSYTLVYNNQKIVEDPGGPAVYSATTFGKDRYSIKCISSYGHPVPLVAGLQQAAGASSVATILNDQIGVTLTNIQMDIASAYKEPGLLKLNRSFGYKGTNGNEFSVSDEVTFDEAKSFETAIITRSDFKVISNNLIEFYVGDKKVNALVKATGGNVIISSEKIEEEKPSFTRIAIGFEKPVERGNITVTYKPADN